MDNKLNTALHHFCNNGAFECVKIFATEKNINISNLDGETSLFLACNQEYDNIVEHLLRIPNIDVNFATNEITHTKYLFYTPLSPLSIACHRNNLKIVSMLLSCNINVDFTNSHNENVMHIAILNQNYNLVKLLYGSGKFVEDKDYMSFACRYDNIRLIKICILLWGRIQYKHVLQLCQISDVDYRTVKFVLETIDTETDIDLQDESLKLAISNNHCDLIKILLSSRTILLNKRILKLENYYVKQYFLDRRVSGEWRKTLDYDDPANLFVIIILCSDDYLQTSKKTTFSDKEIKLFCKETTFFGILTKFPIEIQMYISNLVYGSKKNFISKIRVEKEIGKLIF